MWYKQKLPGCEVASVKLLHDARPHREKRWRMRSHPNKRSQLNVAHEWPFTESWEIINQCCFPPLSFGVVYYTAIEMETIGTINMCKFLGHFMWRTLFSFIAICDQPAKLGDGYELHRVHSFIQQIFTECLLCLRQCSGSWGYCSEYSSAVMMLTVADMDSSSLTPYERISRVLPNVSFVFFITYYTSPK